MSALPTRSDIAGTPDNFTAKSALAAIYDFVAQRLAAGTSGAGTATSAELQTARDSLQLASAKMANLWINSDMGIDQRAVTTAADGAYCLDRTYVLTESGSLTVSQLAQPTDGIPYALRLTQPDVSAKRMGFAQAIEARNCLAFRGSQLVFAPKLRSSGSVNLRVALLAHTGTADTITRDVVNNWASGTYTPGNFFINTNLSVIAVGSAAVTANTWTDVPVSSASAGGVVAPSGMNNLILMVWTESTQAQNSTLDASVMRAGLGTQTPIWTPPSFQQELASCQRYYHRISAAAGAATFGSGYVNSSVVVVVAGTFPTRMRAIPTLDQSGNAAHYAVATGGATTTCSSVPTINGNTGVDVYAVVGTVASGLTLGQGAILVSASSSAYIGFSAEL